MDNTNNIKYKISNFNSGYIVLFFLFFSVPTVIIAENTKITSIEQTEKLNEHTGKYETIYKEVEHYTDMGKIFGIIWTIGFIGSFFWRICQE